MARKMKLIIVITIIIFSSCAVSESTNHLQFQCQPELGCGIFDQCTSKALNKLKAEMENLLEEKIVKTMSNFSMSMEKLKKEVSLSRTKDLQKVRDETNKLMQDKIEEMQSQWVDALQATAEDLEEKNKMAVMNVEDIFQAKINASEKRLTSTISSTNKEIKSAFDKAMAELKDSTKTSIVNKIEESEKKFSSSLLEATLSAERSIKKATSDLRVEINKRFASTVKENEKTFRESVAKLEKKIIEVEKRREKELSSFELKLSSIRNDISNAESKCDTLIKELDRKLTKSIENAPKENITMEGISNLMETKIEAALTEWNASLTKEARDDITTTALSRKGLCNLPYDGKCFWAVEPDLASTFFFSKYECEEKGGTVANIYSQDHYDMIVNYLRSLVTRGRSYIDVWLGMTINPETGIVSHQDGSTAAFTQWEPGSPAIGRVFDQWTHIYLIVRGSETSTYQGMVNSSPEDIRDAVLCEI